MNDVPLRALLRVSRERDSLHESIKFENSLEKTHKSGFPLSQGIPLSSHRVYSKNVEQTEKLTQFSPYFLSYKIAGGIAPEERARFGS